MRGGGRSTLGLLLGACLVLSACGALRGGVRSSSCDGMSGGACTEQVDRIAAHHPGATQVDVRCTVPICDRRGGSGTAVVTMGDGSTVDDVFTYVGDPMPLPRPTCTGVPPDACRSLAEDQADIVLPSKRIVSIEVACTMSGSCTAAGGQANVKVTLSDGTTSESGTSWSGGQP